MPRKLAIAVLLLWLAAGTVLGGVLLVKHLVALPTPSPTDPLLRAAIARVLPQTGERWRTLHVMYRACPCSRRTIEHLAARRPIAGTDELIVMVDDEGRAAPRDAELRAAGFHVLVVTPQVLRERFAIEAAPVFIAVRPGGAIAYIGGYNRRKQAPQFEDAAILAELQHQAAPQVLPVFGCATSERLSRALDPLRLQ